MEGNIGGVGWCVSDLEGIDGEERVTILICAFGWWQVMRRGGVVWCVSDSEGWGNDQKLLASCLPSSSHLNKRSSQMIAATHIFHGQSVLVDQENQQISAWIKKFSRYQGSDWAS